MATYQRNRQYELIVGKGNNAVKMTGLQIEFSVTKTASNKDKKNKAKITIYNLSRDRQALMEDPYTQVVLSVGYEDTGMLQLFAGQAFSVGSRKQGTDILTEIELDELYSELNFRTVSRSVPEGKTVKFIIQQLLQDLPEVSKSVFAGKNINQIAVDGYPLCGSPKSILNALSSTYQIDWQIDNGTLFVSDKYDSYTTSTNAAYLITENSGLIERPYYDTDKIKDPQGRTETTTDSKGRKHKKTLRVKRKGVKLKILLNPAIYAGTLLKLEYADFTGFYKVTEVTHTGSFRGNDWYSEILLAERISS